jgi:DNA invertase Pin-like site-specific DNA recombinase
MTDYEIAKYLRISKDDTTSESMSIPHQRLLLDEFIEELDIPDCTVHEFEDNGYSGVNMNRPGVQEMLDMVRGGKINCIIVKDFSRFSRDAMESGYYIEQVFPLYGIRFISVSDHFDSNDYTGGTGGLDVAFKFLLHDYYSRDLSKKIKSAKHMQMRRGENIVGRALYGYRKNDAGKWEHDPPTADVVRQIFGMALDGKTTAQIRDTLFADRRPTPREYESLNMGKDIVPEFLWASNRLNLLRSNEQYTGTYIAGKRESTKIPVRTSAPIDRSEWTVIPGSHPAIVSKEDFDRVQELLKTSRKKRSDGESRSEISRAIFQNVKKGMSKPRGTLFGYRKNADGCWVIDEANAEAVKMIYDLALQGFNTREMVGQLKASGFIPPGEQLKMANDAAFQPTKQWSEMYLREILKNEQYTGVHFAGKSFQSEDGTRHYAPKSEWVAIPGRHPAIISKEIFGQVQETFFGNRQKRQSRNYLLKGKVACGICNRAMQYEVTTGNRRFCCKVTLADPAADCYKLKVSAAELEDAVMTVIKKQAEVILASDDLSALQKHADNSSKLSEYEKELLSLGEHRQRVYEAYITGGIDRKTYSGTRANITAQIDSLRGLVSSLKQFEHDGSAKKKTIGQAKEVLGGSLSHQEIVDTLIEKIHVFPENHLEITWKLSGFALNA